MQKTITDVRWVLEKDTFDEGNPEKMAELILSKGMQFKWMDYVPFGGDIPHTYTIDECVVVYGSINLTRRLITYGWTPVAWLDTNNLKCSHYYSYWGKWLLQQDYCFLTFAELERKRELLYTKYGEDDCLFIRPDSNFKVFSGKVVAQSEFKHWYDQEADCYNPDKEALCVIARPRNILKEWRFVISKGKVITGSLYKENRQLRMSKEIDPKALELAQMIAVDKWQPDICYVMDIAETAEGMHLLEIGGANCAGLYACDLDAVVTEYSALALEQWNDIFGECECSQ